MIKNAVWSKNNPQTHLSNNYTFIKLGNYFYNLITSWAYAILFYICSISIFILFFYQFSAEQLYFLPLKELNNKNYQTIEILLYIIGVIFIGILIKNLRDISSIDAILLDWERKKLEIDIPQNLQKESDKINEKNHKLKI